MGDRLVFDYYYGKEAEQFTFYRIPKMLIKDDHFANLSDAAKILYGLMLDRMSLSIKNEWMDEQDRTYIVYTIESVMADLNCSKTKAIRTMNELDGKHGIGLIEKIRRGLGKPDIIYVKNFIGVQILEKKDDEKKEEPMNSHGHTEVSKVDFKKLETETSRSSENGLSEAVKMDFRKSNVGTSRSSENRHLEVSKTTPNDTDLNDTDWSHTNHSHPKKSKKENHPINPSKTRYEPLSEQEGSGEMGEVVTYLKNKIEYDMLVAQFPYSQQNLDELLVIMAEAILSTAKSIRIGETDVPQKLVRSRFEQYDYGIMEYVLESLKANTTKIHKIKAYLLTTLYNAPLTINNYYSAEVQHDMRGGR